MCVISAVAVVFVYDIHAAGKVRGESSSSSTTMTRELSQEDQAIEEINGEVKAFLEDKKFIKDNLKKKIKSWTKRGGNFGQSQKKLLPAKYFIGLCGNTEEEVRDFFSKLPGVKFAEEGSEDATKKMEAKISTEADKLEAKRAEQLAVELSNILNSPDDVLKQEDFYMESSLSDAAKEFFIAKIEDLYEELSKNPNKEKVISQIVKGITLNTPLIKKYGFSWSEIINLLER